MTNTTVSPKIALKEQLNDSLSVLNEKLRHLTSLYRSGKIASASRYHEELKDIHESLKLVYEMQHLTGEDNE